MCGEWKDIETAPKDGTTILLYQDGNYAIAKWCDTSHQEQRHVSSTERRDVYEWVDVITGYWDDSSDDVYAPTHWMPLPSPPAAQS